MGNGFLMIKKCTLDNEFLTTVRWTIGYN